MIKRLSIVAVLLVLGVGLWGYKAYPLHPLSRSVLPKDFVVLRKCALGFVDRAQKASFGAVLQLNDASLAMDENTVLGNNPNLDSPGGQQLVELAVSFLMEQRLDLSRRFVPPFLQ